MTAIPTARNSPVILSEANGVSEVEGGRVTIDYELLERQLQALFAGETDFIANAANFAAFVYHAVGDVNWSGFYFAQPSNELVLGPFCGRPACARLPPGRGVCGAALSQRATIVVDDVGAFADHIVCDTASRSEIAVPIFFNRELAGVFDCDSPSLARFTDRDRAGLERLVAAFTESVNPPARFAR
jgi:L-methionine (R)-S-oxide reductase